MLRAFEEQGVEEYLGKPILVAQNGFPQAPSQEENIRKTDSGGINLSEGGRGILKSLLRRVVEGIRYVLKALINGLKKSYNYLVRKAKHYYWMRRLRKNFSSKRGSIERLEERFERERQSQISGALMGLEDFGSNTDEDLKKHVVDHDIDCFYRDVAVVLVSMHLQLSKLTKGFK